MDGLLQEKNDFMRKLFGALPLALFVVDEDVRIQFWSDAAAPLLGPDPEQAYRKRGGEVLHCIHATDVPGGCGKAEYCKDCVVRQSVNEAFCGNKTFRSKTRMELQGSDDLITEVYVLVTAAPFDYEGKSFALLALEDISELIQLRSILPICAGCKKIRGDGDYWETVEKYFSTHLDVEFSHSLCPECRTTLYPSLKKE
jgi:PAS domain-containing protein